MGVGLQISGRASVKAKLKLSFTSSGGRKIVAVKLLQVTCKAKDKREYKQLDSVLKSKMADGTVCFVVVGDMEPWIVWPFSQERMLFI